MNPTPGVNRRVWAMAATLPLLLARFDHSCRLLQCTVGAGGIAHALRVGEEGPPAAGEPGAAIDDSPVLRFMEAELHEVRARFAELLESYEKAVVDNSELHQRVAVLQERADECDALHAGVCAAPAAARRPSGLETHSAFAGVRGSGGGLEAAGLAGGLTAETATYVACLPLVRVSPVLTPQSPSDVAQVEECGSFSPGPWRRGRAGARAP